MTKPELGTKRLCAGCATKFYDLMKDPIVCPKCETEFVVPKTEPARTKRNYNAKPIPAAQPVEAAEEPAAKTESEDDVLDAEDDDKDAEGGVALLEDDEEER